jgi:hypothetical protein
VVTRDPLGSGAITADCTPYGGQQRVIRLRQLPKDLGIGPANRASGIDPIPALR